MWSFFQTPESTETQQESPKTAKPIFWNPFQLPLTYREHTHPLSPTVAKDLELLPTTENPATMYDHLLLTETSSQFAKQMTGQWAQQFTTDTEFLKETQQIVQNLPPAVSPPETEQQKEATRDIQSTWEEITLTEDFKEKFNYLEFSYLEPFNQNSTFLECLNLIHLTTPIFTFIMFIFFVLLPIFLMLYSKTPFSIDAYVIHLASLAKVSFLGKMAKSAVFNGWCHFQTIGMIVGCLLFYGVQFYNSYVSYFRFWRNVETVNRHLLTVRTYVQSVLPKMKAFLQTCKSSSANTYKDFCRVTHEHVQTLESIDHWLEHVQPYSYSIAKCYDFGNMFQCYYEFHNNREFDKAIRYATGFQGYWENIKALQMHLSRRDIACASFPSKEERLALEALSVVSSSSTNIPLPHSDADTDSDIADVDVEQQDDDDNEQQDDDDEQEPQEQEKKATKIDNQMYGMYYPAHSKEEAVRNDCNLAENWIITGPNASGKTTYLKTVALNLIFTQQFGMGFYEHCVLYYPYSQYYTYLNIPDTSDRDSLFQAEVRRGKEILDSIRQETESQEATDAANTEKRTFLLMDELFSGTNHDDAVEAAYGFLCYLGHPSRQNKSRFLLTTHFVDICDKIESVAPHVAQNGKMLIEETGENIQDEEEIRYLYQFKEGISRLRCGIHILKQMNYPTELMHYLRTITAVV